MERASGILMPVSALPGRYGIGTLGKNARGFADFLKAAGQKYWQILPLGPTSYGDSPYQSFSSYAGNPYFVDPDIMLEEGLLTEDDLVFNKNEDPRQIDYGFLYETRFEMLAKAAKRAYEKCPDEISRFENENAWVRPYAEFMAVKTANGMKSPKEWTVREYDESMSGTYRLFVFIQYEFYRQWDALKSYVNGLGIKIIGDVPIYVSYDSAEVWAEPEQFALDSDNLPVEVSGVPPDYFSKTGQLWGNPLYNYEKMEQDGYSWWIRRIGGAARLYDVIRIDHFRGFASYWSVPAEETTAVNGRWVDGPGMKLVGVLTGWFRETQFIAEDLGILTPDVTQLLKDSGLPGMKVLQFAFDGDPGNAHLPHNYTQNCVCYTGTHDNDTLAGWLENAGEEELSFAKKYAGLNPGEGYARGIIRLGMSSQAKLFVAPLADYLGLGSEARINTPGTLGGNWTWRSLETDINEELAADIAELTERYGRM